MSTYLGLYKHQVDKQHHEIMFYVFVCEPLAARTLREADAFPERPVVRFAVFGVEGLDGVAAFYADGHLGIGGSCGGYVGRA